MRSVFTTIEIQKRVDNLMRGDRRALSKTITLIESTREDDRKSADLVLKELLK
jgi:putative protein kinase ArgK-like GTPase of G3E family